MGSKIKDYLRWIGQTYASGDATEHSYRPALKNLVESFDTGIAATNEPKRTQCGAPDFIVARRHVPLGCIECKDIGQSLDRVEVSDQFRRYLDAIDNLILTDYLQFRRYAAGARCNQVSIARLDADDKINAERGADAQLEELFRAFLAADSTTIGTPKELAARMAGIARIIREAVERAFNVEDLCGDLHNELESFRATILNDLTPAQFADMFAQTVCYGLFSARVNVPANTARKFTREHAAYDLPPTNPFLREVFEYVAGTRLPDTLVWAVDLLAEILRRCDIGAILQDFGKAARREDPIVHFYETFLAAYDPKLRETRGVYYTPEPVVSYIVRSIDHILKTDFGCPSGLADRTKITARLADPNAERGTVEKEVHRVQILDPATGTGTFLYEVVRHIYDSMKSNRGLWAGEQGYVAKHLLPRLCGFELMMAPYAVAHMKLGWLLKETNYTFPTNDRLRVYLTNTLEEAEILAGPLLALANQIAKEANAASKIKTESPIMVVMGNPPYSGHSANQNQWSKNLLKRKLPGSQGAPGYFEYDGEPLGERNPKWLNDDYVKFIRFAQYRIERTGYGVLGFVTNHAYLDNPTFRGMRQSLMHTFDDIYILDLHGNERKKEVSPDGSVDKNVFDIMQGVSIGLFVKRKNGRGKKPATVRHLDAFGSRDRKYAFLNESDVSTTKWKRLLPAAPFHLFVPQDVRLLKEYQSGLKITDLMPVNSVGIVTARDNLTIQYTADDAWKTVRRFASLSEEDARKEFGLGEDAEDWKVQLAQRDVKQSGPSRDKVAPILYRPFDHRFTYYTGRSRGFMCRPRFEVMEHMRAGENLGLITSRMTKGETFRHAQVSRLIVEVICMSPKTSNNGFLFPLYLYPDGHSLFENTPWPAGKGGRRPNLTQKLVDEFSSKLRLKFVSDGTGDIRKTFGPEDVFHYIYAIFHNPTFRARFADFLKLDFPRVPFTGDKKLFARMCELGAELVTLHLLEQVPSPRATYPSPGGNRVEMPHYKPPTDEAPGRAYINTTQYFDDVPPEVWNFHVGGYQVCHKWLKERKGRTLAYDEIETYRRITEALRRSIRISTLIDDAIPSWPLG